MISRVPPGWQPPPPEGMYEVTCGLPAKWCRCDPSVREYRPMPSKPRSVVVTTLLVLLTIFVIAPAIVATLFAGGCSVVLR